MPEMNLLKRLQRNDGDALASLMWLYYDDLHNYGGRFTTDTALVKDCIQEIFISLWQRRETADTILSPKFYLLRAIKNKILKSLHKNNNTAFPGKEYDFSYELSIEQIIIEKQINEEKVQKLRKTLELLSKKQKEIVYLKYYHHLDHAQIAELMNVTRQTVYNLLHETLHKLRGLLKADFIAQ
ncbi:MAG TPA: sigma-70 family RNA polymerase sigma factor [Chitinophagaceae bacterium]|nr:sigma-70 family RNA polymerase sigma factor [Chitinophagaceae bacterium]